MHVIVVTAGSAGDVHPFVALGRTLKTRGHDVLVLANEMFGDLVRAAGLELVEHGTEAEFREAIENPDLWHPRKGLEIVARDGVLPALPRTIDAIRARRRDDTVLVAGTLGLAARVVQEADGVPLASVHLAPAVFRSVHRVPRFAGAPVADWSPRWWKRLFWRFADRVADPLIAPALNEIRAREGLAPVSRIFHDWLHSPDLVIGLFPDWFGPPQPDWPPQARLTGFPLFDESETRPPDPELDAWLEAGDAPVLFTAGSANVTADEHFAETVAACRSLGCRGLLVTSRRESVPADLPDEVRWESYVPFSRVLPRAAALVSHGGIGTVAQGIAAGVPQLVTPMSFDQFDNVSRLDDLGVGASLPARRYTAKRAAAALERLLGDEELKARARALPARLAPDPLGAAAALIEDLLSRSRASRAPR